MSPWIELHSALLTHPKVDRLSTKLKVPRTQALGIVSSLWLWVSQFAEDGDLSRYDPIEIVSGIRYEGDADQLLKALQDSNFVEYVDNKLIIHDWMTYGIRLLRQSRERQKKFHDKSKEKEDNHVSTKAKRDYRTNETAAWRANRNSGS